MKPVILDVLAPMGLCLFGLGLVVLVAASSNLIWKKWFLPRRVKSLSPGEVQQELEEIEQAIAGLKRAQRHLIRAVILLIMGLTMVSLYHESNPTGFSVFLYCFSCGFLVACVGILFSILSRSRQAYKRELTKRLRSPLINGTRG